MSDIELVIKIPEETYKDIIENGFIYDEDNEMVTYAIKNNTPLPRWIPVSEGFPKEYNTYEVTLQGVGELEGIDNEVAYATWLENRKDWLYHDVDDWKNKKVIAWKPMSMPYKADKGDEQC